MAFSTRLGPHRQGTVKEGSGANCGFPILMQTATVAYTDTTAKNLFILPAGSMIVGVDIYVLTAFDSDGTDYLSIGSAADDDLIVNDHDVSSTGASAGTLVAANLATILSIGTSDLQIVGIYANGGSAPTAGSARVVVKYIQRNTDGTTTVAP